MKKWTQQLVETEKLYGWLVSYRKRDDKICKVLINFKKEDVNLKYFIFENNIIPTLIKL